MSKTAEIPTENYVALKCECGKRTGGYLAHYDIVRCACGNYFWALRPQRGGPLVAFPWPGDWKAQPR